MQAKTKLVKTMPLPKASDFQDTEGDIYSEECCAILENLEDLEEEESLENPNVANPVSVTAKVETVTPVKGETISRDAGIKLPPLELDRDLIEAPKNQKKLTTPGTK